MYYYFSLFQVSFHHLCLLNSKTTWGELLYSKKNERERERNVKSTFALAASLCFWRLRAFFLHPTHPPPKFPLSIRVFSILGGLLQLLGGKKEESKARIQNAEWVIFHKANNNSGIWVVTRTCLHHQQQQKLVPRFVGGAGGGELYKLEYHTLLFTYLSSYSHLTSVIVITRAM